MLSIIIPALNEQRELPLLLSDLRQLRVPHEVIVSDGTSTDDTPRVAAEHGARVVMAPRGRGLQLRAGAATARGDVLCFLHADVRLDAPARAALERLASNCPDDVAHAFSLRIAASGIGYGIIERGANTRSRVLGLPYGDQGLVVSRRLYDAAGGFAELRVFEDVAFIRTLRQHARVQLLREALEVSPRRWIRDGPVRRTAKNTLLLVRYLCGASPDRLAAAYLPGHTFTEDQSMSAFSRWTMPLLRISMGIFLFMWGVDKLVATAGAGKIFGHFYHVSVGPGAIRMAAALEFVIAVALAVGFLRRPVAWATLAMTLATTLGSWKEIIDPWGLLGLAKGGTHLFLASIPLTAVAIVLVLNAADDTFTVDARLARRRSV